MKTLYALCLGLFATLSAVFPAMAGEPEITMVSARMTGELWQIDVTVRHADTGAEHMLKHIAIFSGEGEELAIISVPHPSVGFAKVTYRIPDVRIMPGVREVYLRAECSIDGWSRTGISIPLE